MWIRLLALLGAALLLAAGARDVWWSDFGTEALPAFEALARGDWRAFVALSPAYVGAMVLRAPLAGPAGALGGGETAIFLAGALPCALALAALGAALARRARAAGGPALGWVLVLALSAASPVAGLAVDFGHPEDLLAAAAAVGAVLAARDGRAVAAGALLGLAVATKQWAVLAVAPALLAAPAGRVRLAAPAALVVALVYLPVVLADPAQAVAKQASAATTGPLFHPHQLFWPLGVPATPEFLAAGHGTRMAPAWLAPLAHPLIVALALPLSALWWRRGGPRRAPDDALLLLALLFLARCALDPWNLVYYQLPMLLALLAWEVATRRPLPVLTLVATAATYASFVTYDATSGTGPYLVYLAWVVPLAAWMGATLFGASLVAPCPAAPPSAATPSSRSTRPM
jgi:hypothetical protein